ncbi:unnamed protein product [Brassica oleracea var. botrytis]|uniref:(rape) hypothetical protein n=1 Tax=Brassica napus TaxID=3708 RepID=A0A816IYY5_BRANA|nr:unnamed protein product [Brassica napus]
MVDLSFLIWDPKLGFFLKSAPLVRCVVAGNLSPYTLAFRLCVSLLLLSRWTAEVPSKACIGFSPLRVSDGTLLAAHERSTNSTRFLIKTSVPQGWYLSLDASIWSFNAQGPCSRGKKVTFCSQTGNLSSVVKRK